jgi:Fic family protein
MKKEHFANSPAGSLVPTERGQWAFVPNDLPPADLDLGVLAVSLGEAARLLGELNGVGRTLPDPYLLIRPLQVREALTSSSMEGTYTTIDDLLLLEAGGAGRARPTDTLEVYNYRSALSQAIDSLADTPLSLRTLRNAHRTLLQGVSRHRGATVRAGEFKEHQNFIGAYEIENARFIPPPKAQTLVALDRLEKYFHRDERNGIPDLIDAALIHYQFEAIHPFSDGNGRVGRMLIPLHLFARGVIRQPILYLSPVFEQRKDEYIDLLYGISRTGAWSKWIAFFLDVVAASCRDAIRTADELLALQRDYRSRLSQAGRSANLITITDFLFRSQAVTIPRVAEHLGVQYRSAQLNIEALVGVGILEEVPNTSNPKFFIAREIRDIINQVTIASARSSS